MEQLEGELEIDWGRGFKATVQYASNKNKPILSIPDILADLGSGKRTTASGAATVDNLSTSDFDPTASMLDQRQRTTQEVVARLGQGRFRDMLLSAYGGKCAVTGCSIPEVLEAAHIIPYSGDPSDHVCNGLLLRSDIHMLFDAHLIAIDPTKMTIITSSRSEVLSTRNWRTVRSGYRNPRATVLPE